MLVRKIDLRLPSGIVDTLAGEDQTVGEALAFALCQLVTKTKWRVTVAPEERVWNAGKNVSLSELMQDVSPTNKVVLLCESGDELPTKEERLTMQGEMLQLLVAEMRRTIRE